MQLGDAVVYWDKDCLGALAADQPVTAFAIAPKVLLCRTYLARLVHELSVVLRTREPQRLYCSGDFCNESSDWGAFKYGFPLSLDLARAARTTKQATERYDCRHLKRLRMCPVHCRGLTSALSSRRQRSALERVVRQRCSHLALDMPHMRLM